MTLIHPAVISVLLSAVLSASSRAPHPPHPVHQQIKTAFFGEDVHMAVPARDGEVLFRPKANASLELLLVQGGRVVHGRGRMAAPGQLLLEDVREEDEGVYTIRGPAAAAAAAAAGEPPPMQHTSTLLLSVRDCALETVVKYGDTYHFPLSNAHGPITLEFRHSPPQLNASLLLEATDPPPLLLYNQTAATAGYEGRLRVGDRKVVLHGVTMTDEGSYTVLDRDGRVRGRNCLNVIKHEDFFHLEYDETLRLNLHQSASRVSVTFTPSWDPGRARPVLHQGVLVEPADHPLGGRLSLEDSHLLLRKTRVADRGLFRVTDLQGFPVADAHVQVDAFKLSNLYVVILSLLGLIAALLVLCLLSCLYKVHRRKLKSRELTLLAQQAGKGDGQAFRQVVQDAYSRFTEESQMQSSWEENPTESTEVTIKGLEVSRPGHYQALPSYREALEMSDSGAECPSIALPLDSDTEGPPTCASHIGLPLDNLLSDSTEAPHFPQPGGDIATPDLPAAAPTPDLTASASPASNDHSHAASGEGPDTAADVGAATPNGSWLGPASPGATSPPLGESEQAKMAVEGGSGAPGGAEEGVAH